MFTGIVESKGIISKIIQEDSNRLFFISSDISDELYVDQSISHNGVCLTVVEKDQDGYKVVAIQETLQKSNLDTLKQGDVVNLERSLKINYRLDGHFVQGHIDTTAIIKDIQAQNGSWLFHFEIENDEVDLMVEKGSICLNGISLTLHNVKGKQASVSIIPYTYEYTNLCTLDIGDSVNIEFDILGKYVKKMINSRPENI